MKDLPLGTIVLKSVVRFWMIRIISLNRVVAVVFSNFHFHFTNLQLWKIEKVAKRGRSDFTIGTIKRAVKLRI